jgi:hypothetical protein
MKMPRGNGPTGSAARRLPALNDGFAFNIHQYLQIDAYQGDRLCAAALSDTTITIFASSANPTLVEMDAGVNDFCEGCAECGYRVLDRLPGGDVVAQLKVHLVELLALADTQRANTGRTVGLGSRQEFLTARAWRDWT